MEKKLKRGKILISIERWIGQETQKKILGENSEIETDICRRSHPRDQRKFARELSKIANSGKNVCLTTNSDCLIKELNILVMLKSHGINLERFNKENNTSYQKNELLSSNQLVMCDYDFEKKRHIKTKNDQRYGVSVPSMDKEIDEMNDIEDALTWRNG